MSRFLRSRPGQWWRARHWRRPRQRHPSARCGDSARECSCDPCWTCVAPLLEMTTGDDLPGAITLPHWTMVDLYAPFHISNSVASEVARSIVATWTVSIVCWHWRLFPLLSAFAACLGILALVSAYRQLPLGDGVLAAQTDGAAAATAYRVGAPSG